MTVSKNDVLSYLKENKRAFEYEFSLAKVGLMGSFSRNEITAESDIDLIVEFKPGTVNLFEIKERLKQSVQKQFGRKVDVCREKYLKSYYKSRILKDAIFVWKG